MLKLHPPLVAFHATAETVLIIAASFENLRMYVQTFGHTRTHMHCGDVGGVTESVPVLDKENKRNVYSSPIHTLLATVSHFFSALHEKKQKTRTSGCPTHNTLKTKTFLLP